MNNEGLFRPITGFILAAVLAAAILTMLAARLVNVAHTGAKAEQTTRSFQTLKP